MWWKDGKAKEVKRAEMLQYKEKMNTKMSSGQKGEGDGIISTQYGNTGEEKWQSKHRKREEFKRKKRAEGENKENFRREKLCASFTSEQSNKLWESAWGNSLLSSN